MRTPEAMTCYRISRSIFAAALLVQYGLEQSQISAQSGRGSFTVDANLVLIPVTVTDRQDRPITGLTQDNFQVYEAGSLRSITSFSSEDALASIVLVFDQSRSMKSKLRDARVASSARKQKQRASGQPADAYRHSPLTSHDIHPP